MLKHQAKTMERFFVRNIVAVRLLFVMYCSKGRADTGTSGREWSTGIPLPRYDPSEGSQLKQLHLLVLAPFDSPDLDSTTTYMGLVKAAEMINARDDILQGYRLLLHIGNSKVHVLH